MHLWWQALDGLAGGLNIAYEAVDRHVDHDRGACAALRFVSLGDSVREMTYGELCRETNRFANVLGALGVGDTVFTLLGRCPALYVASLGALKIGAIFSPLFSAFGPDPIAVRLAREPLHAAAVLWGRDVFGQPFRDTWWQTETGAIMIANTPGSAAEAFPPGAMGRALPGVGAQVVRRADAGEIEIITEPNTVGELALNAGWPSMFRDYLGEHDRYLECFAGGYYLTGDLVRRDAKGWFWFVGRMDDVIKSAGHLIGPVEVERVLLSHPAIAEAGVIGVPDTVVGEIVKAFVVPKDGVPADETLRRDLRALARKRLGASVAPRDIVFRPGLPKTRSGKILRRLLKAREVGLPEGDLSTLEPDSATPCHTNGSGGPT